MTPTYGCNTALQPVVSYGLVSKYRRSDSSSHTYSSLIAYYDSFMVKR